MDPLINYKKLAVVLTVFAALLFISRVNNPPNGRTGAPGDGSCGDAGCHNGFSSLDGSIVITGLPDQVETDSIYPLRVTLMNPNGSASRGGFQLLALGNSNDSVGLFNNPDPSSTLTQVFSKIYWEHQPAKFFDLQNAVTYEIDWQAPADLSDTSIIFYTTGVISNGNGASSGDLVVMDSDTIEVIQGTAPFTADVVEVEGTSCYGFEDGRATVIAQGGMRPYNYAWESGESDSTATNLSRGFTTVTVSDSRGDTLEIQTFIPEPDSISIDVEVMDVQCFGNRTGGANLMIEGGISPYEVAWSDGGSSAMRDSMFAGIYVATVTDANGCRKLTEVVITEPGFFIESQNFVEQDISCFGDDNGSIDLGPGITGGSYTFLWNTGSIDNSISALSPGTYTVSVTDWNNCEYIYDFLISEPDQLEISFDKIDVMRQGEPSGSVRAIVSGGTSPFQYEWNNGGNGPLITNLFAGNYTVTVTDNNNCTIIESIEILEPDCSIQIQEDVFMTSCFMQCDGEICPQVINGTAPFNFTWSNGSADSCLTDLCPGSYRLTVTDDEGCEVISNFQMGQPTPITFNSLIVNNSCFNESNGRIMYEVAGGTPPYNIEPQNFTDLANGIYSYTITDANGCDIVARDTIVSPPEIEMSIDEEIMATEGASDGAVLVTVSGGVMPYNFLWVDESGFSVSNEEDLVGQPAGCYSLTIIDANGCSLQFKDICIRLSTNIEEYDVLSTTNLFPNPVSDFLTVEGNFPSQAILVRLYDLTSGNIWSLNNYRQDQNTLKIDMRNIRHSGMFILELESEGEKEHFKILKTLD